MKEKSKIKSHYSRHSGNQAKPEHPESPMMIRDAGQASMTGLLLGGLKGGEG